MPGQSEISKNKFLDLKRQTLTGQSSHLISAMDYESLYNMIKGISEQELGCKNNNVYRHLSSFIKQNLDFFRLHNLVNLARF